MFRVCRLALVLAVLFATAPSIEGQFLPPGVLNASGHGDSGADYELDQAFGEDGVLHAVWVSEEDLTGTSGPDTDLFYSQFDGGWSPPELVASYASVDPAGYEGRPRITVAGRSPQVVWESRVDVSGAGGDLDVFFSRRSASGWLPAELVSQGTTGENELPNVIVQPLGGDSVVAWQWTDGGGDADLLFRKRSPTGVWTTPAFLNSNAAGDLGDDLGPVGLATTTDGHVVATWSTDDDFRMSDPVGSDHDVVIAVLPPPPATTFTPLTEVATSARGDMDSDLRSAVAVLEGFGGREVHVVWTRFEDGDADLHHAVHDLDELIALGGSATSRSSWLVNSNGAGDAANDDDASLCFDRGGVLHVVWSSQHDFFTGPDPDVFHAANATAGDAWTEFRVLGLHGFFDGNDDDAGPRVACSNASVLSATWESEHDLGGTAGSDSDVLHSFGLGSLTTRPVSVTPFLDTPGSQASQPSAIEDSQGRIHALFLDHELGFPYGIWQLSYDDATGWSQGPLVAWSLDPLWQPLIGIDSSQRLHAVWLSPGFVETGSDFDVFYSSRALGEPWSIVEVVNSDASTDTAHDADLAMVVEPDGTVHVAWSREGPLAPFHPTVHTARRTASGWQPTEVVFSDSVDVNNRWVSIGLDGATPIVVWSTSWTGGGSGSDYDIAASRRVGGVWAAPTFVNDATSDGAFDIDPRVATASNGEVFVAWLSDFDALTYGSDLDVLIARSVGSSWSAPTFALAEADAEDRTRNFLSYRLDADDKHHLAWVESGERLRVVDIDALTPLPTSAPILTVNARDFGSGGDVGWYPRIAFGTADTPHYVWSSDDDLGGTVASATTVLHARRLGPPVQIFSDGFESGDTSAWN